MEYVSGSFFQKYFNVLVEDVSDRVVINVLNGVQDEVRIQKWKINDQPV